MSISFQSCRNCIYKNSDMYTNPLQSGIPQIHQTFPAKVHISQIPASCSNTDAQIPVYLGGKPGSERILYYRSISGYDAIVEIQKYDKNLKKWVSEYIKTFTGVPYIFIDSGYWEAVKKNVILLYYTQNHNNYMNYTVIGRSGEKSGRIVEITRRKDIFQGSVWMDAGRLFESEGNRYRVWRNIRGRLLLVPYKVPLISGAKVITYSIERKVHLRIEGTSYIVPAGTVVQLIRIDNNPVTERILYGCNSTIKFIPHKSAFKIIDRGKVELTIIPDGYSWDKAVNIGIEAI